MAEERGLADVLAKVREVKAAKLKGKKAGSVKIKTKVAKKTEIPI